MSLMKKRDFRAFLLILYIFLMGLGYLSALYKNDASFWQ